MSVQQIIMALSGITLSVVDSADFDGTNDMMARGADLTGAVDAKSGVFSGWMRLDGSDGANKCLFGNASGIQLLRNASNVLALTGTNSVGGSIMDVRSASTYTAGATWLNMLFSWDLAAGNKHLYVNDVSDLGAVATFTDDTLDYTTGNFWIGSSNGTLFRFNGCMAEMYLKMGAFLDFSVTKNRRKFISAGGKPIYLGATGTRPGLGTPEFYLHLADGEAVANFATNRGGGGNFTITGTLDTGSTSPSD